MPRLAVTLVVALCGLLAAVPRARAQDKPKGAGAAKSDENLPSAEEVLGKVVDALGGKAALEKVTSRVTKGHSNLRIDGQSVSGTFTLYEQAPNKVYALVEWERIDKVETVPDGQGRTKTFYVPTTLGKVQSGTDGQVHWVLAPTPPATGPELEGDAGTTGARVLKGEERAQSARASVFNMWLHWRELYNKAECVGREDVDDGHVVHHCYKVVLTPKEGHPETYHFDQQTYLPTRVDLSVTTESTQRSRFADYKRVDGIRIPHKITKTLTEVGTRQTETVILDSVEHNADIPADRFALPEPIKALLAKSGADTRPAELKIDTSPNASKLDTEPTTKPEPGSEPSETLTLDCGSGVQMQLKLIPAGTFTMGCADRDADEKPPHEVTIGQAFYIGIAEVTQVEWEAVMGSNPSYFKSEKKVLPVERVTWDDCRKFCEKLSATTRKTVRLPTEAEWEYACRAGSAGRCGFEGGEKQLGDYGWYGGISGYKTHPVGAKEPNAWGLYDMHGNVWEWCEDWYDKYPGGTAESRHFGQKYRVLRGGAWYSDAGDCRAAFRRWDAPDCRRYDYGLRVVVSGAAAGTP